MPDFVLTSTPITRALGRTQVLDRSDKLSPYNSYTPYQWNAPMTFYQDLGRRYSGSVPRYTLESFIIELAPHTAQRTNVGTRTCPSAVLHFPRLMGHCLSLERSDREKLFDALELFDGYLNKRMADKKAVLANGITEIGRAPVFKFLLAHACENEIQVLNKVLSQGIPGYQRWYTLVLVPRVSILHHTN